MNALAAILGDSPAIHRLRDQLEQVLNRAATAPRPPSILLRGETGTGKGLVARTIHRAGPRARGPFVDVNCAAIPENLLEAELFGYERGAFTDARQAKPGLFQLAHRGMMFLDEIGMLPPALQAKLLKVLEDGGVRRLGGTRAEPVDVWIVAATNEDLAAALRARRFREDLYHRLAVLSFELPPLRERGADVIVLAERFLSRACADYGLAPKTFARDARTALAAYGWPGNVRELGNVVERVALLGDESVITGAMLALPVMPIVSAQSPAESIPETSRERMRAHLLEVLTETSWNISQTAVRLGVARNTVLARIARFGLSPSAAARPRPGGRPRRESAASARPDARGSVAATVPPSWEQRRVALLRVDVGMTSGLAKIIAQVETFGGTVVELGRNAFVAAFGMDVVEDAPVRAALAALAVVKATERTASEVGAGPRVKVVVHVAPALVSQFRGTRTIDLDSKRAAWATIDALAGLDQLGTIAVSEAAAPFLERRFEMSPASANEALAFRRLIRRERTGFGLGGRPLSRFVGRTGELGLLTDRLADAARGRGQLIGIVGEPGVGKSRFAYEVTRLDTARDWRVLTCGGVSHGSTMPFLPVSDLLRRYFEIEDADAPESLRAKVTEAILGRHESLKPLLAPLLSLLDIVVDDPAWRNLDPPQQRQRMQDAVKRLLLAESRIQPVVLILEDLHWIDTATQALLDGLVESLPTARLLLLVNYRPEYQHRWGTKSYYSQLRLDALAPESASELVRALLGADPALEPLAQRLAERGNPFVIEESIRTLVETGALSGERGAYRLVQPIEAIEVPATVQVIVAARIERLSADDKELLQTASVIGKDVPVELLSAVASAGDDDVQEGLARLRAAEFLYETRVVPDVEYTFKHALTHEVTYGTLLHTRRTELHARIVAAIERVHADRLTEHVERLAHHAVRGELWEQAVSYLRQAGAKARARSASREAASWFEQALGALEHWPESRGTSEQGVDVRLDLKGALVPLAAFERIITVLREAEGMVKALGDQRRLGLLSVHMCHALVAAGYPSEALGYGHTGQALGESLADISIRVPANLYLGSAYFFTGNLRRAEELLLSVLHALDGDLRRERFGLTGFPAVLVRGALTWGCADGGKFEEGIAHGEDGLRLAETLNDPYSVASVSWFLAHLQSTRGDVDRAIGTLERGLAQAREWNMPRFSVRYAASLGHAYALSGRVDEGLRLLEQAVRPLENTGLAAGSTPLFVLLLVEGCALANRLDDAAAFAERVRSLCCERGRRGDEASALRLLGDVAARGDARERAEAYYRDGLALAEELGMRPLVAHCHAGLGRLFERIGQREGARQHFTTATTMYREMEMTYWLEKLTVPGPA